MSLSKVNATDSAPFWEAFERGELILPWCESCGLPHLPAGPVCPYCLSSALRWEKASLRATLSTWVVERKKWFEAFDPPYIVAEVQLEEGPRMPSQVDMKDLPLMQLGRSGTIVFRRAPNGLNLPLFQIQNDERPTSTNESGEVEQ